MLSGVALQHVSKHEPEQGEPGDQATTPVIQPLTYPFGSSGRSR